MPNPSEVATIVVNGQEFTDWETVEVLIDVEDWARHFTFSVSEAVSKNATLATQQFAPGDECQVLLAGQLVATGRIVNRQAAYDANTHAVMLQGASLTNAPTKSSAPLKNSQYRGYSFAPILETYLQPFGINLIQGQMPEGADTPFKDVSVWPGETIFQFGDRLARQRGIFVHDDEQGNLVAGFVSSNGSTALVEGQNILSANCTINDETAFSPLAGVTPRRGDDETSGEAARKPLASMPGPATYYAPRLILAEEPGDVDDLKLRVQHEANHLAGAIVNATVVVQGWLRDDGTLWKEGTQVHLTSPMLLMDEDLYIKAIRFSQDDGSGTRTTLTLVRPEGLGLNRTGQLPPPSA